MAHLNINFLRNKFDALVEQVSGNVDVLVLSETKIDKSFPEHQFKIPGFCTPFRLDRDRFDGGILVYVQENIPAKLLSSEAKTIEDVFIVLNFRVCVFTSIHLEGFICLGLVVQGTDQRCCVEDVFFLYQVPSSILQYESPSLSN